VKSREKNENVNKLRRDGFVPAVTYGNGKESRDVVVKALDFKRAYENAGENTIIEMEIDGKEKTNVLVYDVQTDVMSGKFIHADLFQVDMKKEIETDIPLEFVGVSPAIKELGGVLVKNLDTVEVRCFPDNIPHSFIVDLSLIKTFDDHVTIGNLKSEEGVEFLGEKEAIIASVTPPRSEEELSRLDEKIEEDVSAVEGTKGKTEEIVEEEKK